VSVSKKKLSLDQIILAQRDEPGQKNFIYQLQQKTDVETGENTDRAKLKYF